MKRFAAMSLSALLSAAPLFAAGADPYEELVTKLAGMAGKKLSEKKIAVLSFDYVDGRTSSGGRAVAEKLTNKFVQSGEFTVIERTMVEKVMSELEFQNRGTVDPDAAKKLGKGLGVEAIVTGTLSDQSFNNVEVNARIIKTETYEIVAAATERVKKDWSDAPSAVGQASQPARTLSASTQRSSAPGKSRGFFDIIIGAGTATMDVEFSNPTQGESEADFGFPTSFFDVSRIGVDGLTTTGAVPFGMRVGGFGQVIGGAFEFGLFSHNTQQQTATVDWGGFNLNMDLAEELFMVKTTHISGDLFLRFPTGDQVIPYLGFGMGLSINNVSSPYVRSASGTLDETVPGFLFRIPFGVRFNPNDQFSLFLEGRPWFNRFVFDRGYVGETDTITMRGFQFLTGIGFLF